MDTNPCKSPQFPNASQSGDPPSTERTKRQWLWLVSAPLLALVSGPAVVVFLWVLVVYVFERSHYVTQYERMEELWPALPIGIGGGVLGGIIVLLRVATKR